MHDLNDLALFAMVVEHRGFSSASRQMGVPKSRLSRRIAQLEERLGVRLLQRSSRSLTVTPLGRLFYERCKQVVELGEAASEVVQEAIGEPQGTICVSCPISLSQFWLTPILSTFMRSHPKVSIALTVSNRRVDPLDESMDIVLRVRRPPFDDSELVVRQLGRTADVLMASPAFLAQHGEPSDVQGLSRWPTLALPAAGDRHRWRLMSGASVEEVMHKPRLVTDDMFALKSAALDGVGVALLPEMICADELKAGLLRVVLPQWSTDPGEIQAVFPTRRGMLPAVRAFIEHLVARPPGQARDVHQ
jgi:DNA-binding transcriptional LysR family regulator